MAEITWPVRRVHGSTATLARGPVTFGVLENDRETMYYPGPVIYEWISSTNITIRQTVYIHQTEADNLLQFRLSTSEKPTGFLQLEGQFILEIPIAVILNYPTRPMLVNPSAVKNTNMTNPTRLKSYALGDPRYEGSVEVDIRHNRDVPLVEAFIDQLSDPSHWFELPLPNEHLRQTNVTAYNSTEDEITITNSSQNNLHGYWGRVGWRTCRVVSDVVNRTVNNEGNSEYAHVIKIVPKGLINGITTGTSNVFSSANTMRVRATSVNAIGSPEFGAKWTINFVETDGQ